jgi:hypothetical protein
MDTQDATKQHQPCGSSSRPAAASTRLRSVVLISLILADSIPPVKGER